MSSESGQPAFLWNTTRPPDTETDEAIRAAVAKNLSDDRHVADTRMFVAEQMPHRQQCSSVVSDHLERDLPRLQADLDSIRIVFTEANQQQTQILAAMLGGHTDTIMQCLAKVDGLIGNVQGAQSVGSNTDAICRGGAIWRCILHGRITSLLEALPLPPPAIIFSNTHAMAVVV